jgi:hypothetical protein
MPGPFRNNKAHQTRYFFNRELDPSALRTVYPLDVPMVTQHVQQLILFGRSCTLAQMLDDNFGD